MSKRRIPMGRSSKYRARRKDLQRKRFVENLEEKLLLTGPQIVGITPNAGGLLEDGAIRDAAPQELTFRFDENQVIDADSLDGIEIFDADSGQLIQPGYIGLGEGSNEVIVRFAESLDDGSYRININGSGANALQNINGEVFNGGIDASIGFELDLAPLVTAVVPQPITRTGSGLAQARNQIQVHFNDDDLLPSSASQARFYQLLYSSDTITNADDVLHLPTNVDYNAGTNIATLTFSADISSLSGDGTYRLRVGTDEALPGAPLEIETAVEVGGTFTEAATLGTLGRVDTIVSSAIDALAYPLNYPGAIEEPGRNDNLAIPVDATDGITIIEYNFQDRFYVELLDQTFLNLISEEQRTRAREVIATLSAQVGVQFVETPDSGMTIASASLPFLVPDVVAVPLTFADGAAGGNWSAEAMRQVIGQLNGEFAAPPDPLFLFEDPTRDFAFLRPIFIDPDLPNPPVIEPLSAEQLFPRNSTIVNLEHSHRPDSNDIDVYQFNLSSRGVLTAETIAQRHGSGLDSSLRLYRDNGFNPVLVAQNDDYFGADSMIDLELSAGTYFVTVTSTGLDFSPTDGNGTGGVSQGDYDLRLSFQPNANNSLVDATGNALDGDADGVAGGVYNYWFQAADQSNTVFVDKAATGIGQRGSLQSPFDQIDDAFDVAQPGDVVRIVGNGGADGVVSSLGDNLAYEIGFNQFGAELPDGGTMVLPQGVTTMIDAGAVFKISGSSIQVGSSSVAIDLSGSAIQVLGTPEQSVIFTSYDDESIGVDTNPLVTTPSPGDWGGILIRNDLDRAEGRFDYEQIGVFSNYINHADLRYGGGRVSVASVERVIDPVHLIDARADVSFNQITFSADAAISVNPDAFEETRFHAIDSLGVDYQAESFTPDYERFGPDIHNNLIVNNTTNGLFVRIETDAAERLERMTVTGRWDDLDVVHVLPENLIVEGDIGPAFVDTDGSITPNVAAGLKIDPGAIIKLDGARIEGGIGSNILAEGLEGRSIVFTSLLDDRFGVGGTFDTSSNDRVDPAAGDWSGLFVAQTGSLSLDHAVVAYAGGLSRVEGSFAAFNAIEIHQADARITNSIIEFSASGRGGQADLDRPGRPDNAKSAIFVRGSSPVIVDNIIRGTEGIEVPAINVDVSTLNDDLVTDYGRATGEIDQIAEFQDNQGALIRLNRLADNSLNGMEVRGGTVSRGTVLDDTDIVHIVFDSIDVPDFVSSGGVRLESSSEESLVIKLAGNTAGFIGSGSTTGNNDRIGGILDIIGQPGHPVVMTSLYDDTVGAGFDTSGQPLLVTSSFNRPLPSQPADSFQLDLNYGPIMRDLPAYREAAELAVRIWESIVEDPIRVTIDVEFEALGSGVLGVTSNEIAILDFDNVVRQLQSDANGRDHESITNLLPDYEAFEDNVIVPVDPDDPFTINRNMAISMANAKALGFEPAGIPRTASVYDPTEALDATILMNIDYETWDFDRADGILPTQYDFTGVMLHEIGHALGFVSSVDSVDAALGNPGTGGRDLTVNTLDLFRLSPGEGAEDFANAPRNLDPRNEHVFYDGGFFDPVTPRNFPPVQIPRITVGDIPLSRGSENGDGNQASHLKDSQFIEGLALGMMDPTAAPGREVDLTMVDRQAFDLIGWDIIGGPVAGDWRGVTFETLANDTNVDIIIERESTDSSEIGNAVPDLAEFVGSLAPDLKSGDENNRLGFTIQGLLNSNRDVDVYSFDAESNTQVWFDIDRTDATLDTVVELVDANGRVLARSDNSFAEMTGGSSLFVTSGLNANPLPQGLTGGEDYFTTNVKDAGFRIFLPGASGTRNTYHVRVRSSSDQIDSVTAGDSSGVYELQMRLQEADQLPGSTARYADISYAVDGIRVRGLPGVSPLAGTSAEDGSLNDDLPIATFAENNPFSPDRQGDRFSVGFDEVRYEDLVRDPLRLAEPPVYARSVLPNETEFQRPQQVGSIDLTRNGVISIAGSLDPAFAPEVLLPPDQVALFTDIDWYQFEVPGATMLTFDIDYAHGIAGPNASLFVYEAFYRPVGDSEELTGAKLIYSSDSGRDTDDLPAPLSGADLDDMSRGSVSTEDPFLGPVPIRPTSSPSLDGNYRFLVAVTAGLLPAEFAQFSTSVPSLDPEPIDDTDRGIFEPTTLPNNPFIRLQPVDTVVRVIDDTFEPTDEEVSTNPLSHFLGDVPLFVSTETNLSLVNPFTGSNGGEVGTLNIPIGDFDLRAGFGTPQSEDWNFYAYSLGDTDANSGNYLVINPDNGAQRGVEDGGNAGDNQFTDDGLVTNMQVPADDPAEPPEIEGSDTGVQFQAIEFFDDQIGYAIGHRPDIGVYNILYQFSVARGDVLGTEVDEEFMQGIEPPNSLSGFTNIAERGVICVDLDDANCDGRADEGDPNAFLSIAADAIVDGQMTITDGMTIELEEDSIFEINIGPEMILNLDPSTGQNFVDGDSFVVNGIRYEADTGEVLAITDVTGIADGDTFTLTSSSDLNAQTQTFEIDFGDGVADGNVAVVIAGDIMTAIVDAINGADMGVQASGANNRISLQGDSAANGMTVNSAGMAVEGAAGISLGRSLLVEETSTTREVVAALQNAIGDDAVALSDGIVVPNGSAVVTDLVDRGIVVESTASSELNNANAIAIDIHPSDSREVVAQKIANAVGGSENGWLVELSGNTFVSTSDAAMLQVGGENPGGRLTGMHFVNGELFVVSDGGGLYTVPSFDAETGGNPIRARYVSSGVDLAGERFSGLTLGPANIEGGRYANTLFATTARGGIFAFDTDGIPQEIFNNGAHSVNTGIGGANGLLFSPADETLWHVTNRKGVDPGHGQPTDPTDLGLSFHFGDANPDLTENRNYNFPGGTHGSLVTDSFSLEGYSSVDEPVLYFNYHLATDAVLAGNPDVSVGLDSFRVYVTDEVGDEARGEWVLLGSNQIADVADGVSRLFDNTWEDQPELYPEDPREPNEDNFLLRRNGLRDPYTENRSNLDGEGFPQDNEVLPVPSEEETIWRQARIDLSQFAGSSSLRLRFDFSSAGGLGFGNGGVIELRAVPGDLIADGDQFVVDNTTFEFDSRVQLSVPNGALLDDGELLLFRDEASTLAAVQLVKSDAPELQQRGIYVSPNLVPVDRESFQLDLDGALARFAFDSDGDSGALIGVDLTTGNLANALADAINGADLPYTASVDGNIVRISDPSVSLVARGTGLIQVTPVALTNTMTAVDVASAVAVELNSSDTGITVTQFSRHLTLDGVASVDLAAGSSLTTKGIAGQNDVTGDAVHVIPFDSTMTANEVADLVTAALATEFAGGNTDTIKSFENTIFLSDQTVSSPGPLGLATELTGDAGHLFDPVRGVDNQLQYVIGEDEFDPPDQDDEPFDETDNNFVVPNTGVFVDDVIVGFASRGESIVDHRITSIDLLGLVPADDITERVPVVQGQTQRRRGSEFDLLRNDINGRPPTLPDENGNNNGDDNADTIFDNLEWVQLVDRSHFLPEQPGFVLDPTFIGVSTGPYQLEIRTASTPTMNRVLEGELFDPRERFAASTTLFAASGLELVDGDTIELSNGDQVVTFEFDETALENGVASGNVPLAFTVDDSAADVATTIRDVMNVSTISDFLGVTASGEDGSVDQPMTSNGIQLHGRVIYVADGSAIDFVETQASEASNVEVPQGQVIIDSNTISNSLMFGIVTEDGHRAVPDPILFDPEGLLVHSPPQKGEYSSSLGAPKNFATVNLKDQLPGVVVSNNVISRSGSGGVHVSGDAGGFMITPPLAGEAFQAEVWDDNYPFIFAITDLKGKTVQFEFTNDDVLQTVTPTVPVFFQNTADCPLTFGCMPRTGAPDAPNMSTALARAINGSGLDVVVFQNPSTVSLSPLFIEGAADVVGIASGESLNTLVLNDWFTPWYDQVDGVRTYTRVVNNTIVGNGGDLTDNTEITLDVFEPTQNEEAVKTVLINDFTDAGIVIDDNAFPTVINNITVNLEAGLRADTSTQDSVIGGNLFQHNIENTEGINIGDFPLELSTDEPLFVDIADDNFYLSQVSRAIDSSLDSLEDRPELVALKAPLGIPRSNVLSPERDVLGQLREDDPNVETPSGLGQNVFKDRGAIDRVDFAGPTVTLVSPRDNDQAGNDKNPAPNVVALESGTLTSFRLQFSDSTGIGEGTGIDTSTVSSESVILRRDGRILEDGLDYIYSFDATNGIIRLTPIAGVWPSGSDYQLELASTIQDVAGNVIEPNLPTGDTNFSVTTAVGSDFGDAPLPYPTILADNGAFHDLVGGFFLGNAVSRDDNGQPNANAAGDDSDDGVTLPNVLAREGNNNVTVIASVAGQLDAWIDLNVDGDWDDSGEQVFSSESLSAGANALSFTLPENSAAGETFMRFRFSSAGGLAPTGMAADGEVEDYLVTIDPGSVWQNPTNALDVSADGSVSPIDVLRVIQEIQSNQASNPTTGELSIPAIEPNTPDVIGFVDVNGDGFVSPLDALMVIRGINDGTAGSGEPIDVDPVGALRSNPIVAAPLVASPANVADAVLADDDDIDDVLNDLDWLDESALRQGQEPTN